MRTAPAHRPSDSSHIKRNGGFRTNGAAIQYSIQEGCWWNEVVEEELSCYTDDNDDRPVVIRPKPIVVEDSGRCHNKADPAAVACGPTICAKEKVSHRQTAN